MKKKFFALVLTVMLAAIAFAGCGGGGDGGSSETAGGAAASAPDAAASEEEPAASGPEYGGVMRIGLTAAYSQQQIGAPWRIDRGMYAHCVPIYETLVLRTYDGETQPWLAEEFVIDDQAGTITCKIREGIKFHDGSDLTPEVVAWNGNKWIEDKKVDAFLKSVEVVDGKVVFTLDPYQNSFPHTLSAHNFGIVSQANYEKYGDPEVENHPCGTGPFEFVSMTPGKETVFKKFEGYWQEGKPYLDGIVYTDILDKTTLQTAFFNGTGESAVHYVNIADAQQINDYATKGVGIAQVDTNISNVQFLQPSSTDESSPLANVDVRKAIALALDRETICDARGFGYYMPAYQDFPEGGACYLPDGDPSIVAGYDVEEAKKILADAGYPDGFKTTITSAPESVGIDQDTVEAMAEMIRAIGIEVETIYVQEAEFNSMTLNGWDGFLVSGFPVFNGAERNMWRFGGMDPDYASLVSMWRPDDEHARALYTDAAKTAESNVEMCQEFHRLQLDSMSMIPLYYIKSASIYKDYIHGFDPTNWGVGTKWIPQDAWMEQDKIE
jgi:peptide/nickel transport system substrate-binding protein